MFGFLAKFHCLPYNISATTPESLSLSLVPQKKYTNVNQKQWILKPKKPKLHILKQPIPLSQYQHQH